MTQHLLFNGEFYAEPAHLISPSNSGFRYGEGLFETIRVIKSKAHLGQYHFERLFNGMDVLGFERPSNFTHDFLNSKLNLLLTKNALTDARVRLTLAGNSERFGGSYSTYDWIFQCSPLAANFFQLNNDGIKISICQDAKKSCDQLSNLKSNNYLPMLMAARHSARFHVDDSLILNQKGNIVETSISNVFLVKNKQVFTPPLSEGPVAGVMRRHILNVLPSLNIMVKEEPISIDQIKEADEVFLSNALTGIRWVKEFEDIQYSNETSLMLYPKLLNE